jgi:DNA-binding NarL/FixJ family response regulator
MSGANGVISRKIAPELLCRSVPAVASGQIWVSRAIVGQLVQQLRITPAKVGTLLRQADQDDASADFKAQVQLRSRFGLTPREFEMVRAIGEAMTNKDIALHFGISEYTVKHHLAAIFDKVGVYSRLELAMFATHQGLVKRNPRAVA